MTHAELEITAELVRDLLRDQHPDLADRPLKLGARGWDNQLWRLGGDLAVRLPWATRTADALLRKEHAWLPALAPRLPLPVPVPQRFGEPSERFPRPWIVTTWVLGEPADRAPATRGAEAADALAAFLTALHQPAPAGAPAGRGRGGALADLAEGFAGHLAEATDLGLIPDPDAVRAVWDDAVAAPGWAGPSLWLHGDLHPANVLTSDGTFCGVVDFGDLCAGDPACDLAACWILLPDGAVDRFYAAYRPTADAATLRRARGWAVLRALGCIFIADAGVHGRPGGKPTWGPPAHASLRRLTATADRSSLRPQGCVRAGIHRPRQSDTTWATTVTVVSSSVAPCDDFTASPCTADRSVDSLPGGASARAVASSAGSLMPTPPAGCSRTHLWNAAQAAATNCTGWDADDPHPAMTRTARNVGARKVRMPHRL